ncbi:MAG: DNA mismatch repair endonuclease MutL [Bacilli bacterium]|nr:DNA mismatch repair endonuclease MutL [Bacilli bacterium]MDD3304866.1 DNA mismatch repair endonuclease MutL [Bacilli bacterium]MDD4053711.1 DNA mismatch repair endonuclease MutL [Bacilli bacterium]MDD4411582.1 DNA mismatch repair endonuclease MutL [Bacilli bacterium]
MNKIQVMNEGLANKIAAGEVVEKCVSVIKELVENSIDAGAKNIKIDLLESGIREMKVTDDGVGMNSDDAKLAFLPHATSKLITEYDLFHISSLGFRGEALPSIASISEILLKTSTGLVGTVIRLKGGDIIDVEAGDARVGTSVTVNNLFYNTPARLKHLGSLYSELSNITDYVHKIALSYPNISFTVTNDGKVLFETDGNGNQLKVIKEIYGVDVVKKMIEIVAANDDYEVSGYISMPELTKSNRNHLITLVNGRVVRNLELNRVINDAYHTYKPEDKFPIVVLNILVDSTLIDVNIHPTKMDIKFSKFDALKDLITNEIKAKLNSVRLIPKVENKVKILDFYQEQTLNLIRGEEDKSLHDTFKIEDTTVDYQDSIILTNEEYKNPINDNFSSQKIPEMYPVGLVKGTYIICQNELGMYMIDQHAAKERVNYEYYLGALGNPNNNTISMLLPITVELPYNEFIIIKENIGILKDMNFEVEELGTNTLLFRSHPTWLPQGYEEEAIRKICDLIIVKEKNFSVLKFNEAVATMMSCKLAIKANENISHSEMETLIDSLRACENPYTCPHGRPTTIFYSNYELEKLFKRSM